MVQCPRQVGRPTNHCGIFSTSNKSSGPTDRTNRTETSSHKITNSTNRINRLSNSHSTSTAITTSTAQTATITYSSVGRSEIQTPKRYTTHSSATATTNHTYTAHIITTVSTYTSQPSAKTTVQRTHTSTAYSKHSNTPVTSTRPTAQQCYSTQTQFNQLLHHPYQAPRQRQHNLPWITATHKHLQQVNSFRHYKQRRYNTHNNQDTAQRRHLDQKYKRGRW